MEKWYKGKYKFGQHFLGTYEWSLLCCFYAVYTVYSLPLNYQMYIIISTLQRRTIRQCEISNLAKVQKLGSKSGEGAGNQV